MKRFFSRSKKELVDYAEDDFEVMNLDEEYNEFEEDTEDIELEDTEDVDFLEINENASYEETLEEDLEYYEPDEVEGDEYYEAEADEENETYYEMDEYGDDEAYYEADDLEDDETYYEAEELEADDLEEDETYYEAEELEVDDLEDEESYYEADEYDEDAYYEDDYYGEDEPHGIKAVFSDIIYFLTNMSSMDRLITATGALVLVFAIVAGSMYASAKMGENQVAAFAQLGTDLEDIGVIGESGLLALSDSKLAKQEAAMLAEEETEEETVAEPVGETDVSMHLSSIQQDLKIKFINKKSSKLIASVPFEVEVVDAENKTYSLVDEDMDGIIYQNGLVPGSYKVTMTELPEKYAEYKISTDTQKVTVKDKIEYKKVDVADEIKSEAEVNAAVEDTKKQEAEEEPAIKDTVAFVESTKTEIGDGGYKEISKATITDPATVARAPRFDAFLKLSTIAESSINLKKGESVGVTTSLVGDYITWLSDNESVAQIDGSQTGTDNTISATGAGTGTITASNGTDTEVFQVTVIDTQITLDKQSASVNVGQTVQITASTQATWTSADSSIATVDGNGLVKGVKSGTTAVTATSADGTQATCMITVLEANKTTISPTTMSIKVGEQKALSVTVSGPDMSVAWTSSDTSVATVTMTGNVTGVKAGTATITATANGISATCTVTVTSDKPSAADDITTPLKDNNGNQVYIQNAAGEYVAAVYADYYKYDKFYIKEAAYKYTGWQTINGSVYYYDADGNVVKGTQVIQGATYNFDATTGVLVTSSGILGIDVSKWNGDIDWNAVKNSGVNYVIIRCGYRGSSTGALIEDPKFKANIKGASAAGLKVGIYFFTQAVNEVEAVEEASMVLSLISGYNISYPVFLDVEPSGGRADSISTQTRTAVCNAFCQTIANSGYATGIYANKTWLTEKISTGSLGSSYKIWLAQYAAQPSYGGKYHLWQYSSKGSVNGIKGHVDMNLSYLGY